MSPELPNDPAFEPVLAFFNADPANRRRMFLVGQDAEDVGKPVGVRRKLAVAAVCLLTKQSCLAVATGVTARGVDHAHEMLNFWINDKLKSVK
jgi:hypothetical protein